MRSRCLPTVADLIPRIAAISPFDLPRARGFVNLVLHFGDDRPYVVRSILGGIDAVSHLTPQGFSGGGDLFFVKRTANVPTNALAQRIFSPVRHRPRGICETGSSSVGSADKIRDEMIPRQIP